ncbi:hypothetical protein A1O1_09061 [Capronia coronata CBS 617.96]|uniref:Uncharacterized protein n=1 Tax=Capronia coronata CBS 617.96 TaxID=1182541 RepID=W9XMV0_9EURO|nr:uncharacterized protein A1O1_09061 [Capronia coronata CBS 617.96]EXJ78660.1 hypothetical protein A1O1_09061 [Capronia coronata CBS 617.96]
MVARANGLLVPEEEQLEAISKFTGVSSYPRALVMPRDRHDNNKTDITKIKVFPTRDEILSDEADFLPSTDLDSHHFLADQAERHIDTHFRLLRHDTFGELKDVLGGVIHAVENDQNHPRLDFGDFRAYQYLGANISYISFDKRRGLEMQLSFAQPPALRKERPLERRKWWEASKRLSEGVLLSFISVNEVQHLFFTVSERITDTSKAHSLTHKDYQATITAKLASHDQMSVEAATRLSYKKARGVLIEFPGVLPATFTPILENLQDMQRHSRLPFRQWIVPDRISAIQQVKDISIPPPLYARHRGFAFALEPIMSRDKLPVDSISIDPATSANDPTLIDTMEAQTDLDRGQWTTRNWQILSGRPVDEGPDALQIEGGFRTRRGCIGIRKIVHIGGQSQSRLLEDHNLRKVSQAEPKTRSETYLLATQYEALDLDTKRIRGCLGRLHGVRKDEKWRSLQYHLRQNYPHIHAQFRQIDEKGFELVGRHPFDLWLAAGKSSISSQSTDEIKVTASELDHVLQKAKSNVHSLTQQERDRLVRLWTQEAHDHALAELYEKVKETDSNQHQITSIHDEVDRRVLQEAEVIGITTTGLARRISTLKTCKMQGRYMRRGRGGHGGSHDIRPASDD